MPPPHPPKTLPLSSSISLSSCQERQLHYLVSIFLSLVVFSRLALPYFYYYFFFTLSFFVAFWPTRARSFGSLLFCIFFPLVYRSYCIISVQVSAARFNRVCFVCFSCVNFNSDFLATHAYHHYDIWRRGLRLKEGFVRVSKLRSSQSRAPTGIGRHAKRGTRQRDLLKQQHEQRDFLSYLSFFFLTRTIALSHIVCAASLLVYLSRYYYIIERILVRIGSPFV